MSKESDLLKERVGSIFPSYDRILEFSKLFEDDIYICDKISRCLYKKNRSYFSYSFDMYRTGIYRQKIESFGSKSYVSSYILHFRCNFSNLYWNICLKFRKDKEMFDFSVLQSSSIKYFSDLEEENKEIRDLIEKDVHRIIMDM